MGDGAGVERYVMGIAYNCKFTARRVESAVVADDGAGGVYVGGDIDLLVAGLGKSCGIGALASRIDVCDDVETAGHYGECVREVDRCA